MAQSVSDSATVPQKRGRGRPPGSKNKGKANHTTEPAAGAAPAETAPAFGHNRADESLFLRHVQAIRTQEGQIEKAKALLKTERGKMKDIRTLAKSEGIVLRELDEALEALETEHVDLLAREQRRRLYFQWLGLPLEQQTKAFSRDEAGHWHKQGEIAGRIGQDRSVPDGVPPDRVQDWLKGWEAGQEVLMRASPLTAAAFKKPGEGQAAPEGAGQSGEEAKAAPVPGGILALKEEHFKAGTELEDAAKATLLEDHVEAWEAAERVVAVFAGKRRILKEPGFEDTGEPDSETSDVEPVTDEEPTPEAEEPAGDDTAPGEGEPTTDEEPAGEAGEDSVAGQDGEEFA